MNYAYAALLILVGLINVRLVRQGLDKGRIQMRFLDITRDDKPTMFWTALTLQGCISVILFILALHRINPL